MCYCKKSLKSSLINDLQNSKSKANLEMVPMIKLRTMTLWDLIQKPTFFLIATSKVFGDKPSQEDETLLCLQAQLSSDEES